MTWAAALFTLGILFFIIGFILWRGAPLAFNWQFLTTNPTRMGREGGILAPGFLDLQVNGAGGRMVDGTTTADWLAEMCAIHARLGATGML